MVRAINSVHQLWDFQGFVDDNPSPLDLARVKALGTEVVGCVEHLCSLSSPFHAVIAVGSSPARVSIARHLVGSAVRWASLVHPDATVGTGVRIEEGSVIAPGARLSTNIMVGRHVHIDQGATIGHDSVIEDFSRLNPQACVSGSVRVGARAIIGANATIIQGLTVGGGATVGAGAVVIGDVAPGTIVKGVPAR